MGSPPHTWRILVYHQCKVAFPRITSTYVENTAFLAQLSSNPKGSPPHTWRIPMWQDWDKFTARITSTCVENTMIFQTIQKRIRDHLHMCGEYYHCWSNVFQGYGSPPHVWRIQDVELHETKHFRITSTCVENTLFFQSESRWL